MNDEQRTGYLEYILFVFCFIALTYSLLCKCSGL